MDREYSVQSLLIFQKIFGHALLNTDDTYRRGMQFSVCVVTKKDQKDEELPNVIWMNDPKIWHMTSKNIYRARPLALNIDGEYRFPVIIGAAGITDLLDSIK